MTFSYSDLADFGWTPFFNSQLLDDEAETTVPALVVAVHRNGLAVDGPCGGQTVPQLSGLDDEEAAATVGDWLLLEPETFRPLRRLDRKSLFKRRAAGTGNRLQLIAANIDTLFIVSSCNQDFNIPRLERYLVLAAEAGVMPVVVLSKTDLTETPEDFTGPASQLKPGLLVETVDARQPDSVACLMPWCGRGQVVALLGSSGVGKSTLVNSLTGIKGISTQGVRVDDAKGRHTTTARALHRLPAGGWLLDTPGMRELQLTDVSAGLDDVFADVVDLAAQCRFADCVHETEPGCAVQSAIAAGDLEGTRLKRWQKLLAEDVRNSKSLAERRAGERSFSKMVKSVIKHKSRSRDS